LSFITVKKMGLRKLIGIILFLSSPVFASGDPSSSFTPGECRKHLNSCFIDQSSKGYFCREPKGQCESSWRQKFTGQQFYPSDSVVLKLRKDCELQSGCKFQPPGCLCHCDFLLRGKPVCVCECGGGAPPRCVLMN